MNDSFNFRQYHSFYILFCFNSVNNYFRLYWSLIFIIFICSFFGVLYPSGGILWHHTVFGIFCPIYFVSYDRQRVAIFFLLSLKDFMMGIMPQLISIWKEGAWYVSRDKRVRCMCSPYSRSLVRIIPSSRLQYCTDCCVNYFLALIIFNSPRNPLRSNLFHWEFCSQSLQCYVWIRASLYPSCKSPEVIPT